MPGKIRTCCDELATLKFIPPKYKKYSDVFEKFEKGFPLPKHSENDREIVLEAPEKLATGFIYNTNEKETKKIQVYIKKNPKKSHQTFEVKNNPTSYVCSEKKRGIENAC